MDLQLFLRVLWRFKVLVLTGLVLAVSLAVLSFLRVGWEDGSPKLTYREQEEWASYARLLVTQPGFEWGSTIVTDDTRGDPLAKAQKLQLQRETESRLTSLGILYARLVESDSVRRIIRRDGPLQGRIESAPVAALEGSEEVLPIISIAGLSSTRSSSLSLTRRAAAALREYISTQQQANGIAPDDRVVLTSVQEAGRTTLLKPRAKTLPIVVFLTVLIAVIGLAFVLENLRPRIRAVPATATQATPASRFSARA